MMNIDQVTTEEKQLRSMIYNIAFEEFQRAREHSDIDSRMLHSQVEAAEFFKTTTKKIRE